MDIFVKDANGINVKSDLETIYFAYTNKYTPIIIENTYEINGGTYYTYNNAHVIPDIKKVIYNPPATIIFWEDGTKTVVKCQDGDLYSKECGFLMALMKKLYNGPKFNDILRKWVWEDEDESVVDNT